MLIQHGHGANGDGDFSSIHNYYEHLVIGRLIEREKDLQLTEELLADVACVALNHLPPRYIRHDVDMSFYLSPNEYHEMEAKVNEAIDVAIAFVRDRS